MTEAQQSDALKNLVLFVIGLAILTTIIALAWYYGVELPAQQAIALHAPANQENEMLNLQQIMSPRTTP